MRILIGAVITSAAISHQVYKHKSDILPVRVGIACVRSFHALKSVLTISCDYYVTTNWHNFRDTYTEQTRSSLHKRCAERLLKLCCTNGGCYIKVGQHLASLDYLFPVEYIETLRVLHSQAPQSRREDLLKLLRSEWGRDPFEVIKVMDDEPLGTASLAQVYRVQLHDDRTLAVKIQHPDVKYYSHIDIISMQGMAKFASWIFPDFKFFWLTEEVKKNLPMELDFLNEAHNAENIAKILAHFKWLKIPSIDWNLSTSRVLTMEYCEAGFISDLNYLNANNISRSEVLQKLGSLYSEMIFIKGYVHCDPHPGNLMVRKSCDSTQIILLDHGLYLSLPDEIRLNYASLWQFIFSSDMQGIERISQQLGVGDMYHLLACIVAGRSWDSIMAGLQRRPSTSTSEKEHIKSEVARYLPEITHVLSRIPRQLILIFRTNDLLRGIECKLGFENRQIPFLAMLKCCVRTFYDTRSQRSGSLVQRLLINMQKHAFLLALNFYEIYLAIRNAIQFE